MDSHTFQKIQAYIDRNPLTILGTINSDGTPHGAVVYACADDTQPIVYFMTKTETTKYKNLSQQNAVSLTSYNEHDIVTLQASGRAALIHDAAIIDMVSKKITRAHMHTEEWLPPIAKLRAGAYVLVGVELTSARLGEFKGKPIGDESIFTAA